MNLIVQEETQEQVVQKILYFAKVMKLKNLGENTIGTILQKNP